MQIDGISALVLILIASFAIDRITTAIVFLLSFLRVFREAAVLGRRLPLPGEDGYRPSHSDRRPD